MSNSVNITLDTIGAVLFWIGAWSLAEVLTKDFTRNQKLVVYGILTVLGLGLIIYVKDHDNDSSLPISSSNKNSHEFWKN